MDLNKYQEKTVSTVAYPKIYIENFADELTEATWIYPALGLGGESGEILEKIKKLVRDKRGDITNEDREAIKLELGDILWYIARLAQELDITLNDVAAANIQKLERRKKKNAIFGSGDNR